MTYGISYVPQSGPLAGIRLALCEEYCFPYLFQTYENADAKAKQVFGTSRLLFNVRIENSKKVELYNQQSVEYYSGRRQVVETNGVKKLVICTEQRPTFSTGNCETIPSVKCGTFSTVKKIVGSQWDADLKRASRPVQGSLRYNFK